MKVVIRQNSVEPAYAQVYHQIKEQILNNELKEGQLLPSIRGLAKSVRTSVITIKRAYQELQDEGLITTVVGKGSFISKIDKSKILNDKINTIKRDFESVTKTARDSGITLEELKILLEESYNECN